MGIGQGMASQQANAAVPSVLPFIGISPVSGQPYGFLPYGHFPYYGALTPQMGLDPSGDRPHMSYGDAALPLGGHLALALKEKIWRGEFLDLFILLHKEPEPVAWVGDPDQTP